MKTRNLKARLSRIHDALFARADALIKQYKPCGHKNVKVTKALIAGFAFSAKALKPGAMLHICNHDYGTVCCSNCRHLTASGCGAEKPLSCRVWLCPREAQTQRELANGLDAIRARADRLCLVGIREDKEHHVQSALQWWRVRLLNGDTTSLNELARQTRAQRKAQRKAQREAHNAMARARTPYPVPQIPIAAE